MKQQSIRQIMSGMSKNKNTQFRNKTIAGWTDKEMAGAFNLTTSQVRSIKIQLGLAGVNRQKIREALYKRPVAEVHTEQRERVCIAWGCTEPFTSPNFGVRMCTVHRGQHVDKNMEHM